MVVGEVLEDELLLVLLLLLLEGLGEHKLLVGLDGRGVELEELSVPVDVEARDAGVVDVDLAVDAIDEDFGGLVFDEFGLHVGVVDVVADLGYEGGWYAEKFLAAVLDAQNDGSGAKKIFLGGNEHIVGSLAGKLELHGSLAEGRHGEVFEHLVVLVVIRGANIN